MDRYQPTNPFVAKQPDGDYYLVTEVDAEIERLKEQCEKWRLACHEGTEAHKRKLDEIAALKKRIKELEDGLFEITSKMAEHTEDRGPDND